RRTGVPQGILACAQGGTTMTQWDPALRDQGGRSLYGAMIRRFRTHGGRVAGLIWYQGESDANVKAGPRYIRRMRRFVQAVRRDARAPRLPVVVVQLARAAAGVEAKWWNAI